MLLKLLLKKFSYSNIKPKIISQLFINGKFVNNKSGKTFKAINPATEKVIAEVQESEKEDVDLAVKAAKTALEEGPWSKIDATERGKMLFKLADLIEKNADELSLLESLNAGKPVNIARRADLNSTINMIRYCAGFANKVHGKTIPINGEYFCYTKHEPVGVCAQIIPWNFPLAGVASKIGPALAMGCTVVLKPAEQTPLTALRIGELINEAGFPDGVVNILPGYGKTTGNFLVSHPLIDKVSFTGSTEVGMHIMKNCHENKLKRLTLELGGKNPNIIMDDADVDFAVKHAHGAVFFNCGQICVAGSRLFVHEKIYDEFVEKSVKAAKQKIIGDPLNEKTEQGPLIDDKQRQKFIYYVNKGKEEGATLLTGGNCLNGTGYYVEPTVFTNVNDEMSIAKDEIFAPVMSILKFKTIDEVITRANNSKYGLASGIVTNNIDTVFKMTNKLKAGTVWVNCYGVFDTSVPYGGYKNSGIGREHGEYALQNYTEVKTVIIKRP